MSSGGASLEPQRGAMAPYDKSAADQVMDKLRKKRRHKKRHKKSQTGGAKYYDPLPYKVVN